MKTQALTKAMAIRNIRPVTVVNDPFRPRPRCQARFNQTPRTTPMPPSSQLRWPVLFAVLLCAFALIVLNFAMEM